MRSIQSLITLAVVACGILLTTGCGPKRESVQLTSAVVAAMNRGVGLMGQYDYDAAVKAFEEALKADPALDDVNVNLV